MPGSLFFLLSSFYIFFFHLDNVSVRTVALVKITDKVKDGGVSEPAGGGALLAAFSLVNTCALRRRGALLQTLGNQR